MNKLNTLVTGVGAEIGQGIVKALRLSRYDCEITGCDANPDSAGFFMCDDYCKVSRAESPDYLDKIVDICRSKNIKLLFPAVDAELRILSENKLLFENINTTVIVQPNELLNIFLSKYNTYKFLQKHGISAPLTLFTNSQKNIAEITARLSFPLIIKPDFGQGSKNLYLVHSRKRLALYLQLIEDEKYVVQQYLPAEDEEYTCAIFNCNYLQEPFVMAFKRRLVEGVSGIAEVSFDREIVSVCNKVSESSNLEGAINIQLRQFRGKSFIFEINPRFSSTVGIRAKCGFNDVEMAIDYFLFGKTPLKPSVHRKKILRYKEEIYLDMENTNRVWKHKA